MPSFKGQRTIVLQPSDLDIGYTFEFPIKSTATASEGFLPYGTTIVSGTVTAHNEDNTVDVTTDLITSYTNNHDDVSVVMKYPSTNGAGTYHLEFVLFLTTGSEMEADYNRVIAQDL